MSFVRSFHRLRSVRKCQKLQEFGLSTLLESRQLKKTEKMQDKKCRIMSHRKNQDAQALEYTTRQKLEEMVKRISFESHAAGTRTESRTCKRRMQMQLF